GALKDRASAEQSVLTRVKTYITMLPHNSRFEAVKVDTNGWTLESVRKRLSAIADEVKEIETAPNPASDTRARLEIYVQMLRVAGKPIFYKGLNAEGSELMIMYPGEIGANPRNLNGYSSTKWDSLLQEAYLRPGELLKALMDEVVDISQRPI